MRLFDFRSGGRGVAAAALAISIILVSAAAANEVSPIAPSGGLAKLKACKPIVDPTQRLACLDAALAELDLAEKAGDVVVVDRAQVHALRRQTFGLPNIDAFKFFERGARPERVGAVVVTLASATQAGEGPWLLRTTEGEVWRQTDTTPLIPDPVRGDTATIRAGMLGAYFLKVGDGRSIKVRREQ